jgi:phosphoserine phosphatase RsbU/P
MRKKPSRAEQIGRVIFEHATRISRVQDIASLLSFNADLARDLVGADRCSVWLIDENAGELWTKVAHGVNELRIPLGAGLVGACVTRNETITANNAVADSRLFLTVDSSTGYRTLSVLVVPLRADGKVIGALQVLNKPGGFSDEDMQLLGFMASYAASEIQAERFRQEAETARLLRHELELARQVQCSLLPHEMSPVRGIECAGFCRPATFVGGDYYDFLELPDGLFSLTLGDVSGKGIPAALLMASIQTLIRSHLLRGPFPLSRIMMELNQAVYRWSSGDRYSTLFCGVLNAGRTELTFVNAGHIPPMIVRSGSVQVERPEGGGLPIGILPNVRYEEQSIPIRPGDLIFCISDGISEAVNAHDEMLQLEVIEAMIDRQRDAPLQVLVEAIAKAVDDYSGTAEQRDDMTVAAARVLEH